MGLEDLLATFDVVIDITSRVGWAYDVPDMSTWISKSGSTTSELIPM